MRIKGDIREGLGGSRVIKEKVQEDQGGLNQKV